MAQVTYTYTLNDNVVKKLQDIVGGGGGNSLIATTDFLTAAWGEPGLL